MEQKPIERIVAEEIRDAKDTIRNAYLGRQLRMRFLRLHSLPATKEQPHPVAREKTRC